MIHHSLFKISQLFNSMNKSSVVHSSLHSPFIFKGDSGATNHYVAPRAAPILQNIRSNSSVEVMLPDNSVLNSTHSGTFSIPQLSSTATTAHILPALSDTSLLSLGQLADDGCLILLNKHFLKVFKNFDLILQGFRNKKDGLWDVPLPQPVPQPTQQKLNIVTNIHQPTKTLIQYLHAALFSPSKSTLLQAIRNNNFIGWPGLTVDNVTKYLSETPATAKGHLDQHKTNIQSTKVHGSPPLDTEDFFPPHEPTKSRQRLATIVTHSRDKRAFFDLTGAFPYVSARGNKYIFILYDYDSNCILSYPLKTKNASEIKLAWMTLHNKLTDNGVQPSTYIMDNEAANELKQAILKYKISYQLTPPHIHRINSAERAIRTFKNHFLAGLASVDPSYPINEWDRLLPQAEITLNLLRTSRLNPNLSAYAILNGNYDFNKSPMAPPGTKVVTHLKPTQRASWDFHGDSGFYVGPALEHYRCVQCLMSKTRRLRVSDTVQFFPHATPFPQLTLNDRLLAAIDEIISTLSAPAFRSNNPSLQFDDQTFLAIQIIANMLHRMIPKPPLPIPRPVILQPPKSTLPPNSIHPSNSHVASHPIPLPRVPLPRVIQKTKLHPHSNLKRRANSTVTVRPFARSFINRLLHIYNKTTGKKETLRSLLNNQRTRSTWTKAASNEYGRLMDGNDAGVNGTATMEPVPLSSIPATNKITYGTMVCDHRPLKSEPNRCRLVVGGDRLTYDNETAAPAANLLEAKLIINSTISTPNARFITADIKDFFLSSIMPTAEYMKMHIDEIPRDIVSKYNMENLQDKNNYVHFKIKKGMYGLKQAAILAYDQLKSHLAPHGYFPIPNTVGMWKHISRPIQFCLCVDDFGIKYTQQTDVEHLLHALKTKYNLTVDWTGNNYCGLTLDWNYPNKHVDVSMPGYIEKLLHRLAHNRPLRAVHAPHKWTTPVFGRHVQTGTPTDTTPLLPKEEIKLVQSIIGALLYYTRAVDPSMYPALNEISITQSCPTTATQQKCQHLLDYVSWHPDATLRYHACDMVLHVDSDAAYLVLPRARSRLAGHFFLSSNPTLTRIVRPNAPILTECKTIQHVVSSAAEAETAALFHNAQVARPIRAVLQALGHPQPPTRVKTDNAAAHAFIHQTMRHKKSKSWDMRYWWLKEKTAQSEFDIFWDKGVNNWADYFTKHFAPSVHLLRRPQYVHRTNLILEIVRTTLARHLPARVC